MAVVTIQVGQCGNQLGQAFFETMIGEAAGSSQLVRERVIETYFQRDPQADRVVANALLVDMEPKVVQKCVLSEKKTSEGMPTWSYDPVQTYFKQGGSGNNWALGYSYCGEQEYSRIRELLLTQLERIDYFGGIQVL